MLKIIVNNKQYEMKEDATIQDVAFKAGFILKPSLWGDLHILINGKEEENHSTVIKKDDEIMFVYEQYNFKTAKEETLKLKTLVAYLKRHQKHAGIANVKSHAKKILNSLDEKSKNRLRKKIKKIKKK